jgi:hypothetical protein
MYPYVSAGLFSAWYCWRAAVTDSVDLSGIPYMHTYLAYAFMVVM